MSEREGGYWLDPWRHGIAVREPSAFVKIAGIDSGPTEADRVAAAVLERFDAAAFSLFCRVRLECRRELVESIRRCPTYPTERT